jgi:hypothetical protein
MRLRPNRCLWGEPPPYAGKGRPRTHGEKFKLSDPSTWVTSQDTLIVDDPTWGRVQIQYWASLHFRDSPEVPMEVLCITRLDESLNPKKSKPMWLAWVGETLPPLDGSLRAWVEFWQ